MKPTNYLRFINRNVPAPDLGPDFSRSVRILQQLWEATERGDDGDLITSEWRDVPFDPVALP